jgi:REP element-mobilizing transposase RayT
MHKGWHSRGYLPHLDAPGELQALTFRLRDAVPKAVMDRWHSELSFEPEATAATGLRTRIARYEDAGHGECLLKVPHAEAVESCLLYSDGSRYRLLDWCVMPNHVHVLIGTMEGVRLGDLVRAWKTYSAKLINQSIGRSGSIWGQDYHDRYIRDESHFHYARSYIRNNPVKAGLCAHPEDWPWSSAARAG